MNSKAEQYLQHYLRSRPVHLQEKICKTDAFHFGDDEVSANLSAKYARAGKKRATSSLEWCFTIGNEYYPEEGELDVITNWQGEPVCIIKITKIQVCPFNEVPAYFAMDEGEGDLTLDYWREMHWKYFSRECERLDMKPTESMPIVLQWFHVVYT